MELKTTYKESVGAIWSVIKFAMLIGIIASMPIFVLSSAAVAYTVLLASAVSYTLLVGREYVIDSFYRIRNISVMRDRLLSFGDNEFILENIKANQIWRGEEPSPDIIASLERYKKEREEFMAKVMELAKSFATNDDKKDTVQN